MLLQQLDRISIWCHPFLLSAVKTQIVQFEFRNEHRRVIDDCVKIVYEISLIALTRDGKVKKKVAGKHAEKRTRVHIRYLRLIRCNNVIIL